MPRRKSPKRKTPKRKSPKRKTSKRKSASKSRRKYAWVTLGGKVGEANYGKRKRVTLSYNRGRRGQCASRTSQSNCNSNPNCAWDGYNCSQSDTKGVMYGPSLPPSDMNAVQTLSAQEASDALYYY